MSGMWRSILSSAVLSSLMLLTEATWGGTTTIPLPDLLGTHGWSDFSSPMHNWQTVLEWPAYDCSNVRLIVRGTMTPGMVRGDGIRWAPQEASLMGSFAFFGLQVPMGGQLPIGGHFNFIGPPGPEAGPFTFEIDLGDHTYILPSPEDPPAVITLLLVPLLSISRLGEPTDPTIIDQVPWYEGIEITTPLTATITEAYWELEGPSIPEPATLSLLALGALAILGRRKRPC